jgi:hypothetical protein
MDNLSSGMTYQEHIGRLKYEAECHQHLSTLSGGALVGGVILATWAVLLAIENSVQQSYILAACAILCLIVAIRLFFVSRAHECWSDVEGRALALAALDGEIQLSADLYRRLFPEACRNCGCRVVITETRRQMPMRACKHCGAPHRQQCDGPWATEGNRIGSPYLRKKEGKLFPEIPTYEYITSAHPYNGNDIGSRS